MAVPHAHNDVEVNYCRSPLTYDSGGRVSTLPPGTPFAFWGAKPHQLVDLDDRHPLAFVTIPFAQFASWGLPADVRGRLLDGGVLIGGVPEDAPDLGAAFDRWASDLHSGDAARRRAAELEVQALLVRMSRGDWAPRRAAEPNSSIALRRAATMAAYIADHAGADVRVADVAAAVHLHPNRAAAVFRSVFGTTVTAFLAQHRVAEAQRLLLTTDLGSGEIATRAGFGSSSAYHQVFRAIVGSPPLRWQRDHLGDG
ncbi:AraC-like DNA-binding protein [Curtobacterium luteum]|uniref:AraC family transcriptional regulator n=2 Tax=Microbacteriaceae TaxID=85023 RepID=A0A8H9GAM9_9MICO|nr:helix-turn-helix domain-containing protein [Curtobacterium luteum]MBM7802204.1 AraC-like DNA-binding protein [Curtobacterium luteum]NUU52310.1 helix-turn-helix domain-containing protein [Curtobacterium luteum]GGL03466.1 AraC family transcriptional regulator [Curtobacterium luteum]